MRKTTSAVGTDATEVHYIYQVKGDADKNHDETDNPNETNSEGVIYGTGTKKCPVKCYQVF